MEFSVGTQNTPPLPPPESQNQSDHPSLTQESQGQHPHPPQPPEPTPQFGETPVDRIEQLLETFGQGLSG